MFIIIILHTEMLWNGYNFQIRINSIISVPGKWIRQHGLNVCWNSKVRKAILAENGLAISTEL